MGWFGFIITDAVILAVICAVLYVIYNIIYHAVDTGKGIAVVSFIINVIALIVLISNDQAPQITDGSFETGTVGVMAFSTIAVATAAVALFVTTNDGDDMGAGISESIGSSVILSAVATIIQCFAESFWPMIVIVIIGILTCVLAWIKE